MPAVESALKSAPSSVRTFGVSWPLLVASLVLMGTLGSERFKAVLADPDTYWHLATGRWILQHGAAPQSDPFSHSMPGVAWTAHEWLSEVILAVVHQSAGWQGLAILTALAFATTLAYLTRFLLSRMEPAHALLFTVLAASMLMGHLLARPHVLVWPLLAVWVGTLIDAAEHHRSPPWWLLAVMSLWANLHGSFMLGLALGGAIALDAVVMSPIGLRRAIAGRWAAFIGMATIGAMLTPSGWHGLWYPIQVSSMTVALDVIGEWRSTDFHQPQMLELWLLLMLTIACLGRVRLPWLRLILVLGLTHLALKHQRHVALLGLVTPFLLASPLAQRWRETGLGARDAESLDRIFRALAAPAQRGAIAVASLLAALLIGGTLQSDQFRPVDGTTPDAALNAAIKAGVTGPVLNSYNFGGYLMFRGVPVFIDGRADMYGDALLKRYLGALQLGSADALPQLLADYHIGWTLLEPSTPAVSLLDRLPGWHRVYTDNVAVVHVRDDSRAAP